MKKTDILFTLLGSNPLVPVTAIKLLEKKETIIYIILSENTIDIFKRIVIWKEKYFNQVIIHGVVVDPFNPEKVINTLMKKINQDHLSGKLLFDTTGGTKQMLLGTLIYLQLMNNHYDDLMISYITASPWSLITTNLANNKTSEYPLSMKYRINEIISLHKSKFQTRKPRKNIILDNLSEKIAEIVSNVEGGRKWDKWKKNKIRRKCYLGRKIKKEHEIENYLIDFNEFDNIKSIINPDNSPLTIKDVSRKLGLKNCEKLCDWFNGFWLETYVAKQFQNKELRQLINDLKVNIRVFDPEFELDVMVLVENRLYVISISTMTDAIRGGKNELKKKIFEVIIRARQIGGWKTYFGLICLSDRPEILSKEVDDYLVDRNVKIFGRKDLLDLTDRMKEWIMK